MRGERKGRGMEEEWKRNGKGMEEGEGEEGRRRKKKGEEWKRNGRGRKREEEGKEGKHTLLPLLAHNTMQFKMAKNEK